MPEGESPNIPQKLSIFKGVVHLDDADGQESKDSGCEGKNRVSTDAKVQF